MSILFGGGSSRVNQQKPATTLRVNSAVYGVCRTILLGGQQRLPWNLIWYGDFKATAHQQSGGKGGLMGGGGKGGKGGGVSYTYSAAVAGGICEGPVTSVGTVWATDGTQVSLSSQNLSAFTGSYSQSAWSYLTSKHPTQADTYHGLCYTAAGPMQLGDSPALPSLTFEVIATIHNAYPGVIDANPKDCLIDFLTNPYYGLGFPASRIAPMTVWHDYCQAAGLFVSPKLDTPQSAGQFIQDLMEITNSEIVWNGGMLDVVPYGDQALSGYGASYTPPAQALYSLGDDDLMPNQGASTSSTSSSSSDDPIIITRKPSSQTNNIIKVEFLERTFNYNPQVVDARDDADIAMTTERPSDVKTYHHVCMRSVAMSIAQHLLGRQQYRNECVITVGPEYMLLDPMDIIEVVNDALGMDEQWLRIKEVTRNPDKSFVIQCEEYLFGTGSTPVYGSEAASGYFANSEVDPGNVSAPILINPPSQLTQGKLESWIAVAGTDPNWGGCQLHVSFDGTSYKYVDQIIGPSRYGTTLNSLVSHADPHTAGTVNVDLGASLAQLSGGSQQDVDSFVTLAQIDNELISYRDVSVISTYQFTTSYLRRGLYGTTIAAHSSSAPFVRLDDQIFKLPYSTGQKGATIYIKLPSFNIYGGGLQDVSTVTPYSYVLNSDGQFYYPQPVPDGNVLFTQSTAGAWSYTVPDGTAFLDIEIWGGGGCGGNATNSGKTITAGRGAGGGGYIKHHIAAVKGTVLSGSVGDGGKNSGDGGNTTIASPSLSAHGGVHGVSSTSNGAGGTASGGNVTNTAGNAGGLTNVWDGGSAGNGGGDQTTNGSVGTTPGGGGAGGYYGAGSAGAVGQIRITARSS